MLNDDSVGERKLRVQLPHPPLVRPVPFTHNAESPRANVAVEEVLRIGKQLLINDVPHHEELPIPQCI